MKVLGQVCANIANLPQNASPGWRPQSGLKELGLERCELDDLPKNAPAKALLAHIITEQTSVPQKWIAQTFHMGSAPYVSKLAKEMKQAMPRSKEWRDVKQKIVRFIT